MRTYGFDENKNRVDLTMLSARIDYLESKLNTMYPVGSIYMSTVNKNPAEKDMIGYGTWIAWGQGRVPIGIGSNGESEYKVAGGTGGNERITLTNANMPLHTHTTTIDGLSGDRSASTWGKGRTAVRIQGDGAIVQKFPDKEETLHGKDEGSTGNGFFNNITVGYGSTVIASSPNGSSTPSSVSVVQPYITCYMWKRTQ